jgi:hypothetical protein
VAHDGVSRLRSTPVAMLRGTPVAILRYTASSSAPHSPMNPVCRVHAVCAARCRMHVCDVELRMLCMHVRWSRTVVPTGRTTVPSGGNVAPHPCETASWSGWWRSVEVTLTRSGGSPSAADPPSVAAAAWPS